jgi:chitinase
MENELFACFLIGQCIAQVKRQNVQFKNALQKISMTNLLNLASGGAGHYTVDNIDPKLCTHLLYQFANIDKSSLNISIGDHAADIDKKGYKKSVALKTQNPQLGVMISVGFANDGIENGYYEQLTANESNIVPFVSSAMDFLQLHELDGLDLDIDYVELLTNAVIKTSFVRLLVALRKAFTPKGYILSLPLLADPSVYSASNGESNSNNLKIKNYSQIN